MNSSVPSGTQTASELRNHSGNDSFQDAMVNTVRELLDILLRNPPPEFPVLKTTCARLSDFLAQPIDSITIDMVNENKDDFRAFLKSRKYKENAIRSYINHVRILLNHAKCHGWQLNETIPPAWRVVAQASDAADCERSVRYLMRIRSAPKAITIEEVDAWADHVVRNGAGFQKARAERRRFWRLLHKCGCTDQTPVYLIRERKIGVPIEKLPTQLRDEVTKLLNWKQAEFAVGRPKNSRHRPVTSKRLREMLSSIYGFCTQICGEDDVNSIRQMMQKDRISSYLEWCINERKLNGYGLQCGLRLVFSAIRQHPAYKDMDLSWCKPLHDSIPTEPESERRRRKAERYLDYNVLESIPEKIRAAVNSGRESGKRHVAQARMLELLMSWITVLPWRQRNVRECRIAGKNPNLFRGKIAPFSEIDKPSWVQEEERRNPEAEFWQFSFSPTETKTKHRVQAVLPRPLVPLLERYLNDHRPNLLEGCDPETLFVNEDGNPLIAEQVSALVSALTLRHGGRRVTPHLYRDIVAFTWLKEHPKDYLTLSKILWHSNLNTTIKTYGSRFNESSGVCAMEAWLEERTAKKSA